MDMQCLLLQRQLLGLEIIVQKLLLDVSEHLLCQCGTLKILIFLHSMHSVS